MDIVLQGVFIMMKLVYDAAGKVKSNKQKSKRLVTRIQAIETVLRDPGSQSAMHKNQSTKAALDHLFGVLEDAKKLMGKFDGSGWVRRMRKH
jgi:hypothetical protein